nr:hypothetical protein [uncultured Ralstonia sp.]
MRWQYKTGGILAIAAIVVTTTWWLHADAGANQAGNTGAPAPSVPVVPVLPTETPPGPVAQPAPAHPERALPARVTDYLEREYPNSTATRQALTQIAYGWSQAVEEVHSAEGAKAAGDEIARGIACALGPDMLAKTGVDQQTMLDRIKAARAVMLDSENDTAAYLRFQSLAGGQYFNDPGPASCDFNASALPN